MEKAFTGRAGASTSEVIEKLNDLLQLDHDSVAAYEVAREHLQEAGYALQIADFQRDHERHIRDLNDLIVELGGAPTNEPHASTVLKEGIQRIAASGGDRRLLMAWRTNEGRSRSRYTAVAAEAANWPAAVRALLERNAADEERHYEWVVGVLGPEGEELSESDGLRDRLAGWKRRRSRADGQGTATRDRVAGAISGAAERLNKLGERRTSAAGGVKEKAIRGAQQAATRLDAVARTLRDPAALDPRPVLEREIRRQPLRTLGAIFAVGFVIGRALR